MSISRKIMTQFYLSVPKCAHFLKLWFGSLKQYIGENRSYMSCHSLPSLSSIYEVQLHQKALNTVRDDMSLSRLLL